MGTWGPGNFENDCAAEYLYEVCGRLRRELAALLADPAAIEPGEYGGDVAPASLEILVCLAEHLDPGVLPPPETIAAWKQRYLAVWEAAIDDLHPKPGYKRQRRAILNETFDRAERLARRQ